jgi:ectoine hydroxylase-related dioxygenase (phytanoyl-CoA dioxygenase family)
MLLHSAQGNLRQYIHRDYNDSVCMLRRVKTKQGPEFYTDAERSTQSFNYSSRPARLASCGIIVALEDNTRFVCWPGSHHGLTRTEGQSCPSLGGVYDSEVVCPTVSKGDVIIFMDTLAHAGAPYTRPNTRMHFYCDNVVEE